MAYLGFVANQFIPHGNYITVNSSDPVRVQNGIYKLDDDMYKVIVHSANGTAWEFEGNLNSYRTSSTCMNIRLAQDRDGNITRAEYAIFQLNGTQEGAYMMVGQKINLTYHRTQQAQNTSQTLSSDDDMAWLDEMEQSQADGCTQNKNETPERHSATRKKGGTGWIIFGILFLLTALTNLDTIQTVIGCGVLGAILLLIGVKKKSD